MMSVDVLNVANKPFNLSVIVLNVVMLSVVAPAAELNRVFFFKKSEKIS